ncbi:hypothetical protein K2X83_00395, partial [Patescibacteria group bacterium]|nr:hypothetical protein [Patescibacteria group bacterium]
IEPTRDAVVAALRARGISVSGNPDAYEFSGSEFGVDDARAVSSFASLKPYGDAKYFLLSVSRATAEAQNALLKVIEEAPGHSVFFFIVESSGHLLPTIRSRCVQISGEQPAVEENSEEALQFLKDSYEARLSVVEKITGYISKTQDRAPSRSFVRSLLRFAKEKKYPPHNMRDLLDADRYLRMQGGSAKAVLSHLAVSLPRLKTSS